MSAILTVSALGCKHNSFRQEIGLKPLKNMTSKTLKLSYSPVASSILPQFSPHPPHIPYLPIILGEVHYTANAAFALLSQSNTLRKNGFTILASDRGISTKMYKYNLKVIEKIIPALQEDIREIMDAPKLSKSICDKLSLWLTDSEVKKFLNSSIYIDSKPPFEKSVEDSPSVMRFEKKLEPFIYSLLKSFSKDKKKLRKLYFGNKIPDISPLDIATVLLQKKGFDCHTIDTGRDHIIDIAGSPVLNDGMILRNQGMMEEVQELQCKYLTNVIGVMGLFHMIALEENYPNSAVYRNVTGAAKPSLHDIRHNKKIIFQEPYIKNSNLQNCLKDAFQLRNLDADFVEPADEVLKVVCRISHKKEPEKASILEQATELKQATEKGKE